MSTETTLKSLLNSLVDGGCYNKVNDSASITLPYIVFHEISGIPVNTIHDYSGITNGRYQVDVFARTPEQAKGLALGRVKTAITGSAVLDGTLIFQASGSYSEKDKSHQYITEYRIWSA